MWFGCRTRDGVAIMLGTSEIVAFTVPDYAARFGCDLLMSGSSWRIVQSELPYFLMRPASESAGTATLLMTNNVLRNRVGETPEAVYLRQINARVP